MRTFIFIAIAIAASAGFAATAAAQEKGLGLGIGVSQSTYTEPGLSIDFGGIAFAFDYQIPVNPTLTVNPFFTLAKETGEDVTFSDPGFGTLTISTEMEHQLMGAQFRFWPSEQAFLGAQLAQHTVTLRLFEPSLGSASESQTSMTVGFVAGLQVQQIQMYAQYDTSKVLDQDVTTLQLILSYRVPAQ